MKFDKAQIFVLVVGIAILLGWDPVCKYMGWFQVPSIRRNNRPHPLLLSPRLPPLLFQAKLPLLLPKAHLPPSKRSAALPPCPLWKWAIPS
jgi:hypothetical protein